jgi:hypothetical protein
VPDREKAYCPAPVSLPEFGALMPWITFSINGTGVPVTCCEARSNGTAISVPVFM